MLRSDLRKWAVAEQMIPNAPVNAACSTMINASSDTVWHLLTSVTNWPQWYGYLKNAQLDGLFSVETRLTYGGLIKHRLRIARVTPGAMVMLYGTMAGYSGITRWDVKTMAEERTKVTFTESSNGPLIALLYGSGRLEKHLKLWLAALKAEAERGLVMFRTQK